MTHLFTLCVTLPNIISEPGGLVGLEMPVDGTMKKMVFGLQDTDPDSDGTRIVIQNPLDTGNVDHSSQMFTKSKTDANGYFTLKSVVSFFNTDYNPTPGKVLALDPESMTTTADDGRGMQCSLLCMKKNRGTLREYFIP